MQNEGVQFQKYPPTQGHLSIVPISLAVRSPHSENNCSALKLERQQTPRDPVSAERVSCSWARDPTKTVWHSVPEVELCPGALLYNAAGTYIINHLMHTYLTFFNLPRPATAATATATA